MINKITALLDDNLSLLQLEKTATVVRLYDKGKAVYQRQIGFSDMEHKVPADFDTVFPISSMTKQFTAAIVFLLKEEGLLQYRDSIKKYLKDFPSYGDQLTIEQLLHQTSGLIDPYAYYEKCNRSTAGITNEQVYDLLLQQKNLLFSPGEKFQYCNSNYILLSMIVEKVTGKNFSKVLRNRLFDRIGMHDSLLYQKGSVISNRAFGYKRLNDNRYRLQDIEWLTYGDGGIHCSLRDLEKWYLSLCNGTVSSRYGNEAFASGKNNQNEEIGYGLGWFVKGISGNRIVHHLGGDPGFGSMILIMPEQEIGLIILSNLDESWKVFNRIQQSIEAVPRDRRNR